MVFLHLIKGGVSLYRNIKMFRILIIYRKKERKKERKVSEKEICSSINNSLVTQSSVSVGLNWCTRKHNNRKCNPMNYLMID